MVNINYNGKVFRTVSNSNNGEVNNDTIFKYFQSGETVWAEYSGGGVHNGHLLAKVDSDGNLAMSYHHINDQQQLMSGKCRSRPEIMDNGKLRMHEQWQWTCHDQSSGVSIVEEL